MRRFDYAILPTTQTKIDIVVLFFLIRGIISSVFRAALNVNGDRRQVGTNVKHFFIFLVLVFVLVLQYQLKWLMMWTKNAAFTKSVNIRRRQLADLELKAMV